MVPSNSSGADITQQDWPSQSAVYLVGDNQLLCLQSVVCVLETFVPATLEGINMKICLKPSRDERVILVED